MVLEHIYPLHWLYKKPYFAFILGFFYAVLSIFGSLVLFPKDPALVAVAFTSLLMFPSLYFFFGKELKQEKKEKIFTIKRVYQDNKQLYKIYISAFLGILLAFSLFSLMLPNLASNHLFREQVDVLGLSTLQPALTGGAYFSTGLFKSLMMNNLKVLIFCFLISLLAGNGAIFLITWNASVWGTIFGLIAKTAGPITGQNQFIVYGIIIGSVLPHLILEVSSYILAAISGSVISKDIIKVKPYTQKFYSILKINIYLLLIAIVVLVVGMVVETYVLGNFETYRYIRSITF